MKKQLVIRCCNKQYEKLLAEYIRKHFQMYFEVATGEIEYDLLIVEEEYEGEIDNNTYVLSTEKKKDSHAVYRFQSADAMIKELLYKSNVEISKEGREQSQFILFYSPGGSEFQSQIAKAYARTLGEKKKVLLVFYGDFSEWDGQEGTESYNLSHLCFLAMNEGRESITQAKVVASVSEQVGYDFLNPFSTPIHASEINKEFVMILQRIQEMSLYDVILCDLQQLPMDIGMIRDKIHEINVVMPTKDEQEEAFMKKYHMFERFLDQQGFLEYNVIIKKRKYEYGNEL